jgi:uncharacterized protein
MMQENQIIAAVSTWLHQVVIGLQLCPFASKPAQENGVRFKVTDAQDDEYLLEALKSECEFLVSAPEVETSLLIVANHLDDFWSYNQFLVWVNQLIKREGYEGVFQIASFHPDYCFAGTDPEDAENLTNRSPYPILHIIREASLEKALRHFPDIDQVPEKNKQKINALSSEQKQKLFPYLFS